MEWRLITDYPSEACDALLYRATAQWHDWHTKEVVEVEAINRYDLGHWDGSKWLEQRTNHEVFECRDPGDDENDPTHWTLLPCAPENAS